jgi:glycosyltransferase involved in cell wall biosynthesis
LDRLVFFDDEAQRWQQALFKKLDEVAADGSVVLIATGAPFQANLLAARYKKQSPNKDLRLIQDFRDVWASNPYKKISKSVRGKIFSWQEEALKGADVVVSVSETLRSQLLSEHSFADPKNFVVIENGFDPDDAIKDVVIKKRDQSTKRKIIHLGSVTNGRDRPLLSFLESLSQNQDLKNQVELQLVGSLPTPVLLTIQSKYQRLVDAGVVTIVGTVDRKQAHKMLLSADFALMLTSPEMSYALSAKIYEYLFFEVPTLSLNYGGEAEAFVKKRNMGLSVNLKVEKVEPVFSDLLVRGRNGFTFDKIGISYPELVDKYLKLIGI